MTLSRNDRYRLTNRERDILDILWESGKSMVASEITSMRDDLSINTVQAVLKKLLQKKLIAVDEIVYSGTVLSTSYKPTMTPDQFEIQKFENAFSKVSGKPFSPSSFVATLLEEEKDTSDLLSEIDSLEQLISQKREELSKKN